ncbi:MAG TPA: hypothetical protein VIG47_08325 [Gemmatimonadaceae bacterium]|jgi:predicted RNA-binding Zn-ribbon protein involved in translation (DUF1610 family)
MFVRIVSEDNARDVAPEIAHALRKKMVLYKCPNCPDLHLHKTVTWKRLEELIKEMVN